MGGVWDVSNSALKEGNISGMWKLTLLTSTIQIIPILFLCLLPQNKKEQEDLGKDKQRRWVLRIYQENLVLFSSSDSINKIFKLYEKSGINYLWVMIFEISENVIGDCHCTHEIISKIYEKSRIYVFIVTPKSMQKVE